MDCLGFLFNIFIEDQLRRVPPFVIIYPEEQRSTASPSKVSCFNLKL